MEAGNTVMRDSTTTSAARTIWRGLVGLMIVVLIGALLALNVLTVLNEGIHERVYAGLTGGLARVASSAVVERLTSKSPTVRRKQAIDSSTRSLQIEKAALTARKNVLLEQNTRLEKNFRDLNATHVELNRVNASQTKAVKGFSTAMAKRATKNAVRNISAIVAESIPILGVAITVGFTTLDVMDACDTIKDLNGLGRAFGEVPADHAKVCGLSIPTKGEVVAQVRKNWLSAYAEAAEALHSAKVESLPKTPPNVTVQDIRAATCPIVRTPTTECRL